MEDTESLDKNTGVKEAWEDLKFVIEEEKCTQEGLWELREKTHVGLEVIVSLELDTWSFILSVHQDSKPSVY